jgi:hypothetical protein
LVLGSPELIHRVAALVGPRLARDAVLEVAGGAAHSQVYDQIVLLVEGRLYALRVLPRVVVGLGEFAALEEALLGQINVQHDVLRVVNVGVQAVSGPLETVRVEVLAQKLRMLVDLVSQSVSVLTPVDTPMQSAAKVVQAALFVRVVDVAATLHDVDLTASWPHAVRVRRRQHPYGGPEPVTSRQLGSHLDTTVLEAKRVHSGQLGTRRKQKSIFKRSFFYA